MRKMCLGASRSRSDLSMICPMGVAWPISTVMRHFLGMETQIVLGGISTLACTPLISLSWVGCPSMSVSVSMSISLRPPPVPCFWLEFLLFLELPEVEVVLVLMFMLMFMLIPVISFFSSVTLPWLLEEASLGFTVTLFTLSS